MEMISVKRKKARKNHICDNCGSNVFRGEEYELQTNKVDGHIYNWKNCDHCKDLREQMFREGYYPEGANSEDFWSFVVDNGIEFQRR